MVHPTAASPQHVNSDDGDRRRWVIALLVAAVAIAVAHAGDEIAWRSLRDARVNERDWGRFLRSMGYLPLWLAMAVALWLHDRGSRGWGWRGGALLGAPALAGLCAELAKLLVRRLRPDEALFGYSFRGFGEATWSTGGLGMPSSHVMVAFAGATALSVLFPRTRWVGFVLAGGCALTRILTVQHFLSDTVAAASFGWLVAYPLCRWMLRRRLQATAPGA